MWWIFLRYSMLLDSSDHWVSERHSAEVHRGPINDNSSAASSSGSEDGHELRGVTQPLFRPSRPSSSAVVGSVRSSRNSGGAGKHRRKSTKSAVAAAAAASTTTNCNSSSRNSNNNNFVVNRPRSASSQNLGSAVVDPPSPDGRISCGLRNEAAPSLESLWHFFKGDTEEKLLQYIIVNSDWDDDDMMNEYMNFVGFDILTSFFDIPKQMCASAYYQRLFFIICFKYYIRFM